MKKQSNHILISNEDTRNFVKENRMLFSYVEEKNDKIYITSKINITGDINKYLIK